MDLMLVLMKILVDYQAADTVFVHDGILDYAVRPVPATRAPAAVAAHATPAPVGGTPPVPPGHGLSDLSGLISHGASPRATLGRVAASRALALLRGRDSVLPQDIYDVAPDVLRHRVLLSYEAIADGVTAEHVVNRVVSTVPAPGVVEERAT